MVSKKSGKYTVTEVRPSVNGHITIREGPLPSLALARRAAETWSNAWAYAIIINSGEKYTPNTKRPAKNFEIGKPVTLYSTILRSRSIRITRNR